MKETEISAAIQRAGDVTHFFAEKYYDTLSANFSSFCHIFEQIKSQYDGSTAMHFNYYLCDILLKTAKPFIIFLATFY